MVDYEVLKKIGKKVLTPPFTLVQGYVAFQFAAPTSMRYFSTTNHRHMNFDVNRAAYMIGNGLGIMGMIVVPGMVDEGYYSLSAKIFSVSQVTSLAYEGVRYLNTLYKKELEKKKKVSGSNAVSSSDASELEKKVTNPVLAPVDVKVPITNPWDVKIPEIGDRSDKLHSLASGLERYVND